jgi:hypothetical protein
MTWQRFVSSTVSRGPSELSELRYYAGQSQQRHTHSSHWKLQSESDRPSQSSLDGQKVVGWMAGMVPDEDTRYFKSTEICIENLSADALTRAHNETHQEKLGIDSF